MKFNFAVSLTLAALILSGLFLWRLKERENIELSHRRPTALLEKDVEDVDDAVDSVEADDADDVAGDALPDSTQNSDVQTESTAGVSPDGLEFAVAETGDAALPGRSVEFGSFTLEANLHRNKTVKIHYGISLNADGSPVSEASNIVFFAPYFPERGFIKKPEFRWYPENPGYTIFSMDIVSELSEVDDRDKIYYYKESGFHDLVFKAQHALEERFSLRHRKLLITGQSAGATMAEQIGCHWPERVDAVAVSGGHRFDMPDRGNSVAWLSLLTAGDETRYSEQFALRDRMRAIGSQCLFTLMPPIWKNKGGRYFHHTASESDWNLSRLFLRGIVALRDSNGGVVPKLRDWPESSKRGGEVTHYPSKEFADAWERIPHEAIMELARFKRRMDYPVYFIPDSPKSIVIYIHDSKLAGDGLLLLDNMYYIFEAGSVAATVRVGDDYFRALRAIEKLLAEVQARCEWKKLPIYVCGLGVGGQLAAVAALRKGECFEKRSVTRRVGRGKITRFIRVRHTRVKKITAVNSHYSWPFAKLSPAYARRRFKSHIPLELVYSSSFEGGVAHNGRFRNVKRIESKDLTLGKKWFQVLSAAISDSTESE